MGLLDSLDQNTVGHIPSELIRAGDFLEADREHPTALLWCGHHPVCETSC